METMRFSNRLAFLGVGGGVIIALAFPFMILYLGSHLSGAVQTTLIILGLLVGAALAGAAAVVGITIPTAISGGGIDIEKLASCCADLDKKEDAGSTAGTESS